jgi:hypothetical protein
MEVLESPNSDFVRIRSARFRYSNDLSRCICSQHHSWDDSLTRRLADYWLGCPEGHFLAGD